MAKKEDIQKMLKQISDMLNDNELTYHRITQLWVQTNCLKQTVEDMIGKTKKASDNGQVL